MMSPMTSSASNMAQRWPRASPYYGVGPEAAWKGVDTSWPRGSPEQRTGPKGPGTKAN